MSRKGDTGSTFAAVVSSTKEEEDGDDGDGDHNTETGYPYLPHVHNGDRDNRPQDKSDDDDEGSTQGGKHRVVRSLEEEELADIWSRRFSLKTVSLKYDLNHQRIDCFFLWLKHGTGHTITRLADTIPCTGSAEGHFVR